MIKNIAILVGICYCVVVATYMLLESLRKSSKSVSKDEKKIITNDEIVLKRQYNQLPSIPNTPICSETEQKEVSNTEEGIKQDEEFAEKKNAQIPNEKLDSVFSEAEEMEEPIEYIEEEEEEEEEEGEDISNDNMNVDTIGTDYNSLVTTANVINNPIATEEQKEQAGKVLLQVEGTALYKLYTKDSDMKMERIKELINLHLKTLDDNSNTPLSIPRSYKDFNISDFV